MNSQDITDAQLARTIDHSLLKPELTETDIVAGCELAQRYHVASVCVKPCYVPVAARHLAGSDVAVGTVVAFPHGSSTTATKVFEARQALADGATELDMVANYGELLSGHSQAVEADIRAVAEVAHAGGAILKVILENAYLSDEQKVLGCRLAETAGADFVKTSTGYAPSGATVADIRLMRATVSPHVQVKAAHGVRTLDALLAMIDAGATRVGATATAAMLEEFARRRAGPPASEPPASESAPQSKAELMARISREWDALQAAIASLSEEQLTAPSHGGWSIKDNLAHIAAWEQYMLAAELQGQTAAQALGVAPETLQGLDENGINDILYRRNQDLPAPAVLDAARLSHEQVMQTLARTPFEDLLKPFRPDRPEPVLAWVIGNTYDHYREHRLYIERLK